MNKFRLVLTVAGVLLGGVAWATSGAGFVLKSTNLPFPSGRVALAQVYDHDGCRGGNLSPELSWSGEPAGTRSYAITIFDVDAMGGRGWWHWVIYDIASSVKALPAGAGRWGVSRLPNGARQVRNDYGEVGYGGPCPPPGAVHRYIVVLYALDVRWLPDATGATAHVIAAIRDHTLAETYRVFQFGR